MAKMKKIIGVLVFFVLVFILAEMVIRSFFKVSGKDIEIYRNFSFERCAKILIPDKLLIYKLIPGVSRNAYTSEFQVIYTTNKLGLRDKEIQDSGKFKIIFLGDSHTFGEGVPYGRRFSDLIERELDDVYSINAGVPGYGIHQMYMWLGSYGINLKPKLVICCFIPLDLERVIYKRIEDSVHLFTQEQDKGLPESKVGTLINFFKRRLDRLLQKSYLYSVIKVEIKLLRMRSILKERDKQVWDEFKTRGDFGRYKITTEWQRQMVREESFKIFLDFKNLLEQRQVDFLAVNISTTPLPWLEDFFRKNNIRYLDLSPRLKNLSNITFDIDVHYNTAGHRVIADYLKEYISQQYQKELAGAMP